MRKTLCVALLCLLAVLPAAGRTLHSAPPPSDWTTYLQPAAGFAVDSPVSLKEKVSQNLPIPFPERQVEVKFSMFFGFLSSSSDAPVRFSATVIEPVTGKAFLDLTPKEREGLLDGLPGGLAGPGGKVIRQEAHPFKDYPGRDFTVRSERGGQVKLVYGRVFLIGNRVLALNAWGVDQDAPTPEITRFFDSFRFMTDNEKRLYGTTNAAEMIAVDADGREIDPTKVKPSPAKPSSRDSK